MARPLKFDRDAVIEMAMHEIWRAGYAATSVNAMSEKLGLTRSSYYNAFGSRADLFKAALAAYSAQSPDRALQDAPGAGGTRKHLTGIFRAACAARAGDPEGRGCMMINALCELVGGPEPELSQLLVSSVLNTVQRLEALLEAGVASGELPDTTDCHATALALQTLLMGLNAMSKAVRSEDDLWLAARTTLAALDLLDT
jgi:TetR/AcrR family transcriptional regulator, transcriptional repressor for nem operon